MVKGDLVVVRLGGTANSRAHYGQVLDYRPDVYGGSWMQSYRLDGIQHTEQVSSPRRGEVLVLFYEDGDMSWIDEIQVEPVQHT